MEFAPSRTVRASFDAYGSPFLLSFRLKVLDVGFKKAYSDEDDTKTPFDRIRLRSANCNISKGGHLIYKATTFDKNEIVFSSTKQYEK